MKKQQYHNERKLWRWFLLVLIMVIVWPCMAMADSGGNAGPTAATEVYAVKGLIYNPGGGPSPTNKSTSLYVGARLGSDGVDIAVWTADGTARTYIVDNTYGLNGQQATYPTGSAVIFNNQLYVFVAEFSGTYSLWGVSVCATYDIVYYVVDPNTYQVQGGRNVVAHGVQSGIPASGGFGKIVTPINVGATVWNGSIYLVSTPSPTMANISNNIPMVWSSADGQSWSTVSPPNSTVAFPSVIHDAVTISSSEVPGLSGSYPNVSDSVIMVVGSFWNNNGSLTANSASVAYYDPANNQWMPSSPIALPAPSTSQNPWVSNAVAYFGSVNGQISQTNGWCNPYQWSPGVPATVHVMAALNNGGANTLSHWYLDPNSSTWKLEQPCSGKDLIWWAGGGCMITSGQCPIAVAPYYYTSATATCPNNMCSNVQVFSAGWNWDVWSGAQHANNQWNITSDYWNINTNYYVGLQPTSYMSMTDEVSAVMRQTWQLIGVIAGPPPFDGTAFNATSVPPNASNVDFGYSSSTSNTQQGTWSTNFTFGETLKMGPPFFKTKISMQASTGASVSQGDGKAFTVTMDDKMGTDTQNSSQFGRMGWVYVNAPVIQPQYYQALWAKDNSTALNYSQTAMVIGNSQKLFYPFYLQNPSQYDANDPGTGVFGLMAGSQTYPLSSDIGSWNLQPQWDYTDDISSTTYNVLAGQKNGLARALQGGISQTQSFTTAQTTFSATDNSFQSTESVSAKLTIPLVAPEASKRSSGRNASSTTEVDMTQGYDMQTSSSSEIDHSLTLEYFVSEATTILVFPYLLQATNLNAPWVPTGYTGPLPWLLTWYAAGIPPTSGSAPAKASGKSFGRSPLPASAGGRMTGNAPWNGQKAGEQAKAAPPRTDSYFIRGGSLAFTNANGEVLPIAMTAATFSSSSGASITINGRKIALTAKNGTWARSKNIWRYRSKNGTGTEVVDMLLDFGHYTWNVNVGRAYFGWYTDPLNPVVTVSLNLNDQYVLNNRINHDTSYHWQSDLSGITDQTVWVSSITVDKNYKGVGKVRMKGMLPSPLTSFGDFSVIINGTRKDLPVRTTANFTQRFGKKQMIRYADKSSSFQANPKTGEWACEIDAKTFDNSSPVRGKDGKTDLRLKIGGKEYFTQRISSDYYTMSLSFDNTTH